MMTTDEINGLISEFNSLRSYLYSDYLITKVFAQPVDSLTHYQRVALLDALFDTQLRRSKPVGGRQRKTIFEISEGIRNILQQLHQAVAPFNEQDLFQLDITDPQIRQSISRALQLVLDSLNNNSLSFTGKYLHFAFPRVFPPWDKLVPQAINDIYDEEIFPENNPNTPENYLLLCEKYQDIASQFTNEQIDSIKQHDFDSQPNGWRIKNTFVRILDKALWIYQKRNQRNAV